MKKATSIILILVLLLSVSGCAQDFYYNSLDDYAEYISENKIGYSQYGFDHPDYFLPSSTFIRDFHYIYGQFNFYENSISNINPDRSCVALLVLKYDETVYSEAKTFMLENIPNENEYRYQYNSYVFYENANFAKHLYQGSQFPKLFTLACYSDENQTLVFLGIYNTHIWKDEDDQEYVRNNWVAFIDENFGMYYDFSE